MTVEEAVQLTVQAGALGNTGEVHVLDMGSPVRIADIAKRLVDGSDRSIRIVFTGLRPGEKLHEDLLGFGEVDVRPRHPLISQVSVPTIALNENSCVGRGDVAAIASTLRDVCEWPSSRQQTTDVGGN